MNVGTLSHNNSKFNSYSDEELFEHYKNSNSSTYMGELFNRYTHLVYGSCMKYLKNTVDAEEAVMEIFEKLLINAYKYKVDFFKSWLFIVTKNHCLQKLNQKSKEISISNSENNSEFMEFQPDIHLNDESELENKTKQLKPAMEQLKDEQKQCVELFYLEGKSYKEIADITDYSIKNVKSYIQNGKRNLKKILSSIKMLFL
ncbi:MAG: sigma-70 family RNA polymerase sigma factor [Bacteroidales bacterium]|nr:sigma-70 family RNA polymerase sigma factor [Bacteroidales bacterium]